MMTENAFKKSLTKGEAFTLFFLTVISAMVLAVVLTVIIPEENAAEPMFWVKQLLYSLLLLTVSIVYTKYKKVNFFTATKLTVKPKIFDMVFVALAVFFLINAMVPVNAWFLELMENMGLGEPDIGFSPDDLLKNWWLAIPTICIVAPISEEIIFRGSIAGGLLSDKKHRIFMVVLGGFLFSIFHMNPAQTLHQFLLGSLLIWFAFEGGLWVAIFGHLFNNSMAILLSLTVEESGFYQNNALICLIAGFLLLAVVMTVWKILLAKRLQKAQNSQQNIEENSLEISEISAEVPEKNSAGSVAFLVMGIVLCSIFWVMSFFV